MGGAEDSQPHTTINRTKMSLCKLLTQRKAKVGCFKTDSEEENVVNTIVKANSPLASPARTRQVLRGSLNRGYSDPESKTTRLSLCCAMTESSSRTPPHSHQFHLTHQDNNDDEEEHHVIQTKDSESQTTNSNMGSPTTKTNKSEVALVEMYDKIIQESTNGRHRMYSSQTPPSRPISCPSSPVKFVDDNISTDTSPPSSPASDNESIPRRVLPQRLSADNLLSPTSPTPSVRHSSPDSVKSAPEVQERKRRSASHDTLKDVRNGGALMFEDPSQGISMDSLARQALLAAQVLHLIPTERARGRNFLQGRIAANSLLGPIELERVLPKREIKIFVGTWNMNGEAPPHQLNDFMLPDGLEHVPDIIAIGTQEAYQERFEWEVKIQETIGPSHVLFHSASLGTIHLSIFIRRDLLWFCSVPEESSHSVRPGTAFRTKGAVAIGFILFGTSYLFITAHLTAHQDKVKERVHDIKKIVRTLDLPKQIPLRFRTKSKDVTQNFDCVFWCGDLNFRLAQAREDVMHWVEEYKFPLLVDLKSDQLIKIITEGTCLASFEEGSITFPPTYKYDVGTQNFDTSSKQRTPAYTDRILFKSRGGGLTCVAYSSVPSISTSDHKPVWGVYKGLVRPGIDTIPLAAGLFNREVYLEGIKRRAAELGGRDLGLSGVCTVQ